MHKVLINDNFVRTDLILELNPSIDKQETIYNKNIKIIESNQDGHNYTTIKYDDITDNDSYSDIEKIFITKLKKYLKPAKKDIFLIIGLGNSKSTPDSLGPKTIDYIIPTRYLFEFGDVEEGYSCVASYTPNVIGNTGIESISIIKGIIKDIKATKLIIIDSLKASNLDRLVKTIQITDKGIFPGSGINNNRGEISKKTTKCDVIAIGVPTVVDINSIINNKDNPSFIVTPTNIDFVIDKLSKLIGECINITLHKNINRQINSK